MSADMSLNSSNEFEKEFDKLMNLAEVSFCSQTPASTRKKWKIKADAHLQLDETLKLPERDNVDSDAAADSCTFIEEIDKATASSKDASAENMLLNASFGYIPKLVTDLEKMEITRNVESGTDVADIERLVKSVSRALQELIHVLCASRLYFDDKLDRVKQIRGDREGQKVFEKSQIPPRKKRSATTLTVSDTKSQNRKNTRRLNKEEYQDMTNCTEEVHSLEGDIRGNVEKSSNNTEYLEDGSNNNNNVEGFSKLKTDRNDANQKPRSTLVEVEGTIRTEHGKETRSAKFQIEKNDDTSITAQTEIEKVDVRDTVNVNRCGICKSKPYKSEYKAGISSEMELPDENIERRSWRERRNSNQKYHDGQATDQFKNLYQQHPRKSRYPNDCKSSIMPSHGTYAKGQGRVFRPARFRDSREEKISTRQRSGSSNLLEGGDVFQGTGSTQRSVATETDFSQARERSRNSNATLKSETHSSSINKSVASGNVDFRCIKVSEKNFEGNKANKKYTGYSEKGTAHSSVCQRNVTKPIDKSPKPTDKPKESSTFIDRPIEKPESKSDTPKQDLLKNAPGSTKENVPSEGKSVINLSRPISNSSLNPAAKSFRPSNFRKAKENMNSPAKLPGNQIFSGRETDTSSQSKNSEFSSKKPDRFTTDWTIESSENDFISEENGISNNLNALNIGNGHLGVNNNAIRHGFDSRAQESDQETVTPNSVMNGSGNRSENGNVFLKRMNGAFKNDEKSPKNKNSKNSCSASDLNTDGATYCNDEPEQDHQNTSSKQGLGMNSACGDFVVTDDVTQPNLERQEVVNPRPNADVQVRLSRPTDVQGESIPGPQNSAPKEEPGLSSAGGDFGPIEDGMAQPLPDAQEGVFSFTMDPQNRDVSDSAQGIGNQISRRIAEIELNFVCLSDSETSELYSDLSEEFSYDENNAEQDI